MVAKGKARLELNTVDIEIGLAFSKQTSKKDGHMLPKLDAVDVKSDIKRDDIKIVLSGNYEAEIINELAPIMEGFVADCIENALTAALTSGVPAASNAAIVKMDGVLPLPFKYWFLDWQTPESF